MTHSASRSQLLRKIQELEEELKRRPPRSPTNLTNSSGYWAGPAFVQRGATSWVEVADALPQVVFETDPSGTLIFITENAFEWFGYQPSDFDQGLTLFQLISPDRHEIIKEKLEKVAAETTSFCDLSTVVRADGTRIPVEICASRVVVQGHFSGFRGSIFDRTEEHRMELALRESEAQYRSILENLEDVYYRCDMDGRVLLASPSAPEQFGYQSIEEILQVDLFRDVWANPEDRLRFLEELSRHGFVRNHEIQLKRKDGTVFWGETNAHILLGDAGQPVATEGILRDITHRKQWEARLQHTQKMEAIGNLAGGVAHDFNNLLTGIHGSTELMLSEITPAHPHYEYLKGIQEYVRSASNLTRQLLGFARGGKYEAKPSDFNQLLKKSCEMFARARKEIAVETHLQEGLWTVDVDRGQMEQVLMNLYINAWQAMPHGGCLSVSSANVELDRLPQEGAAPLSGRTVQAHPVEGAGTEGGPLEGGPRRFIRIRVRDTGVGMDPAVQRQVFDPFFTTKEKSRGAGLGLASVYGIVKNHGGTVEVESSPGNGSTFTLLLPASQKPLQKEFTPALGLRKGAETVLLVDDEQLIINVGRRVLQKLGYEVLTAESGPEALEIYKRHGREIQLVILDLVMPGMGGGETFDRLRECAPDVKVLLASGYSYDGEAVEIIRRGCNGFIQKPFDMDQFSQKIRQILDAAPKGSATRRL